MPEAVAGARSLPFVGRLPVGPAVRASSRGPLLRAWVALVPCLAMTAVARCPAADPPAPPAAPAPGDGMDVATRVRIDRLVKAAEAALAAGEPAAALQELRSANALVKQACGPNHPDTLPILDMAADILVGNGQFAEAGLPLERAIALRESLLAEGRRVSRAELAASLVLAARVKSAQGDFAEAAAALRRAVSHFEAALEADDPAILAARRGLADGLTGLGDHAGAAAELAAVVDRIAPRGEGRPEALVAAAALARATWLCGRHDEARARLAAAVAAHERARGPRDDLPEALALLGEMELAAGDAAAAGVAWKKSLDILRGALGDDHAATAADRLRIARLDLLAGETGRARDVLERVSADLTALAGRGDPLAAAGLRSAAGIWLESGDPAQAAELLRHALEADRAALGAEHPDAAADEAALGRCLLDAGDPATARRFLEHARAVLAAARGPGHPETLGAVATLGAAAAAAGDRAAAEECLATLLNHRVPRIDDRTEGDLCRLADGLGGLADAAGERDAGVAKRLAIVGLRQEQFGEAHPFVVADLVAAAEARKAAAVADEAAALYERALALTEAAAGGDHPDTAAILVPLAQAYRALGAGDLAARALERALVIWEKAVGKSHPATLATLKSLALARLAADDSAGALPLMERLLAAYDADPETDRADVVRLLKRLSAVHESRGDDAKALALMTRAADIDAALGTAPGNTGRPAADPARLERLLAGDEDAQAGLARARDMVPDIESARARIARATAGGPRASGEGMAAAAAKDSSPDDIARGLPDAGAVITSAWERCRAGKPEEGLALVREATSRMEAALPQLDAARRCDLADLLAAAADLRPQVLAWNDAARLYERAALLDEEARGTPHAVTLARMLALADVRRASGEARLADDIVALVAAAAPQALRTATPAQAQRLGKAVSGALRVALAAGDRAAAARLADLVVTGWADDDALLTDAIDALVMMPDAVMLPKATGVDETVAAVVMRAAAAATRLAATAPRLAGLALHATAAVAALRGDRAGARLQLEKALDTDRRVAGRNHPRTAVHLLALADLAARGAEGNGAADLLASVRDIEARAGQAGGDAVGDLRRLAARHVVRGELSAATPLLKAALAAETKGRRGDPFVLAAISAEAGAVSAARGSPDRAEELFTEAVSLSQSAGGAGHPDTVAHAVRRERARTGGTGPSSGPADPRRAPAATADAPGSGSLAQLLRGANPAPRTTRPGSGRGRETGPTAEGPADAGADNAAGAGPAAATQAEKARRAFDAVLRLYGGDPAKKKRAGAGRRGLESVISYTAMLESMAANPDGGLPTARGPAADEAAPAADTPTPAPRNAPPGAARAGAGSPARPSPFIAASTSGLRQRAALAKRRAAGAEPAEVTVATLMRAAWSSHFNGSGEDAALACDQAVTLAARQGGEASLQLEETLDQAAAIAVGQGDYARAKPRLERLGSLRWKRLGAADPLVVEVALRLAAVLAECGEYDKARALQERSAAGSPDDDRADPAARARATIVRGRVELGSGNAAEAIRAARRATDLVARAWDRADRPPEAVGKLVRLRLATAALLEDAGDCVAAREEIDRLWLSVQGGPTLSPRAVEAILAAAARTRRLTGDAAGAAAIAAQGVAIVQRAYKPCPATAEQLVELALARRAAGDAAWEEPAREATRILVPAARRMTPASCDPAAIESLRALAAALLDAGRGDRAAEACAAAQLAAAALPPTHPTAMRVARLAARLALEQGDAARADATLAAGPAPPPRRVAPIPAAFLEATLPAADAPAREALARRRADATGVSPPAAKPSTPSPAAPVKPAAAAAPAPAAALPAAAALIPGAALIPAAALIPGAAPGPAAASRPTAAVVPARPRP